jgi:CBS domain-containing protein
MNINLHDIDLEGEEKILKISTATPVFCYGSNKIQDVIEMVVFTGHRRIPIVSKEKEIIGIFTKSDVLEAFLRREDFDERITKVMTREVITCNENDSIDYVLSKFKMSRRGGFPVIGGNKLVGMVSERDFIKKVAGVKTNIKVSDVMVTKPFIIRPGLSIIDCFRTMVNTRYRRLPVVKEGMLQGIITSEDLLRNIYKNKYSYGALNEKIDTIMVKAPVTTKPDADLGEAAKLMVEKHVGGLVVIDEDKKMRGIITERDILERIDSK